MKKVLVGMFALIACAGMAVAAPMTTTAKKPAKPTTYTCVGFNKSCSNTVGSSGAYCSSCAQDKAAAERYKRDQEEICTQENYDNGSASARDWNELNCADYLNNKK